MIMISSPAGQRLARAWVQLESAKEHEGETGIDMLDAYLEVDYAAEALAKELIADNHHLGEGD